MSQFNILQGIQIQFNQGMQSSKEQQGEIRKLSSVVNGNKQRKTREQERLEIQLSHPLSSPSPPSIFPSIRVFPKQPVFHIKGPEYWSFSFSISPSNEYSGLISFRMDWLDLIAGQGTLKSSPTPQFKSINSSVLSFLYSPILTSIHDSWKNHSFDKMNLFW